MENVMTIAVWVIALVVSFVPMPLAYKLTGITISIMLIVWITYQAKRANRLPTTNLIINLLIIGWDVAILYMALR